MLFFLIPLTLCSYSNYLLPLCSWYMDHLWSGHLVLCHNNQMLFLLSILYQSVLTLSCHFFICFLHPFLCPSFHKNGLFCYLVQLPPHVPTLFPTKSSAKALKLQFQESLIHFWPILSYHEMLYHGYSGRLDLLLQTPLRRIRW